MKKEKVKLSKAQKQVAAELSLASQHVEQKLRLFLARSRTLVQVLFTIAAESKSIHIFDGRHIFRPPDLFSDGAHLSPIGAEQAAEHLKNIHGVTPETPTVGPDHSDRLRKAIIAKTNNNKKCIYTR